MKCWSLLLALTVFAAPAFAQQHPNQQKGFTPNAVYQFNDIDAINAFNGNLTLTIPIGAEYSVGGGLTYAFVLHSNANVWEGQQHCHENGQGQCIQVCPLPNKPCGELEKGDPTYMHPHRRANAGIGWTLSFGRLYPPEHNALNEGTPWIWESPSGADHEFEYGYDAVSTSSIDSDSTYMRMSTLSDGTRQIEFPDGTIHIYQPPDAVNDFWALRRITNRFPTNYVEFSYAAIAGGLRWNITDSHGRSHVVDMQYVQHDSFQRAFVTKVALSVNGTFQKAETSFEYAIGSLTRPTEHNDTFHGNVDAAVPVQLLRKLSFPDGTSYGFTYVESSPYNASGLPLTVELPTGGTIGWTWGQYGKPWSSAHTSEPYHRYSLGVANRKLRDRAGALVTERSYTRSGDCSFENEDNRDDVCFEWSNKITDFLGTVKMRVTKHYFSVARSVLGVEAPWSEAEYGKPFTKKRSDGTPAPLTRWLSMETMNGAETVLRSTYVRYEAGPWRQASSRVVFNDDGNRYLDTDSSDWDGHGHYRTVKTSGNLPQTRTRVVTTNYLPPLTAWLTGLYDYRTVQENGTTLRSEFDFDQTTGFLRRKRTLKGETAGPSDLLAIYSADTAGNVKEESYYGGDQTADVGTTGTLDTVSPGTLGYRIKHVRTEPTSATDGSIVSTYPVEGGTDVPIAELTIDRLSGRVASSTDMAGVKTDYSYDWAGRVTWEKRQGAAWSRYEYMPAGAFEIRATQYPNSVTSGASLKRVVYGVDAFGRVNLETIDMPDDTQSRRVTTFDGLGRTVTVSELGNAETLPVTSYVYDALDRVTSVTTPDQKSTRFVYQGQRVKTRYASIRTGVSDTEIATREEYDGNGRLIAVVENSESTIDSVRTEYQYDAANHIADVKMNTGKAGAVVQNRVFDYDGRGFLRWESHPESGLASYTYDARGHLRSKEAGAAKTTSDVQYQYDVAERLTKVLGRSAQNSGTFRLVKEFSYRPSAANVLCAAKLLTAARYNYPPGGGTAGISSHMNEGTIRVTETYGYGDAACRATARTTTIEISTDGQSWTLSRTINQTAAYDALDQRQATGYPICVECGLPRVDPNRSITTTRKQGLVTSLSALVDSIDYWPNGLRKDMKRSNGMVDKQTIDAANMLPRPKRLSAEPYCAAPVIAGWVPSVTVAAAPAMLSVSTTRAEPLTYQWYRNQGAEAIPGATNATYAAPAAGFYSVEVSNSCGAKHSANVQVAIGACVAVSSLSADATRNSTGSFTLTARATGSSPITYEWYTAGSSTPFATGAQVVVTNVVATTTFTVKATNSCGPAVTAQTTAAIALSFPPSAVRAAPAGAAIRVTWLAPPGSGYSYTVQRRTSGGPWTTLNDPPQTAQELIDTAVVAGQVYVYRVLCGATTSDADAALIKTFTPITTDTTVAASHFEELRDAVNRVRAASGWSAIEWSNMLGAGDPLPNVGEVVLSKHILALQLRMNEALHALGVPVSGYIASGAQQDITVAHIQQLQRRIDPVE